MMKNSLWYASYAETEHKEIDWLKEYILLLPIIFIFHDMEEIVGFERFFTKNPDLFDRYPKIMKAYKGFKTDGFALAVYEEFIPFFGISLWAYFFPGKILYALWYALMLSLTGHFIIHIGQSLYIRKYIPSLITSIICLPVSAVILIRCVGNIEFSITTVLFIFVGIAIMILNLKIAHMLMHRFNRMR